ncbi:hypothetical protein [Ligilactobacillus salivarius]|uniref:hypothetical protein n=1 Tax=Ligilactobacillus salivarius TaxID=1624 RepID=UPI000666DD4A|nr:hypothetical protein [Ligilactobacillus salivarius]
MRKLVLKSMIAVTLLTGVTETITYINAPTVEAKTLSKKKVKKVNKALKKALKEDQGFATGKLDENGNPTDNGTPNPKFDYATYVNSLKYQSSGAVKVQMNDKLTSLNTAQMDEIAHNVQGLVDSTLMIEEVITPEDTTKGVYLNFYYGKRAIGHSKLSDHKEFKWYTN